MLTTWHRTPTAVLRYIAIPVSLFAYLAPQVSAEDFVYVSPAEMRRIMISSPSPKYPLPARVARQKGRGLFRLVVRSRTGEVTRVEVAKSTGYHLLDNAAVRALRQWRLRPGTQYDGLIVPVIFRY